MRIRWLALALIGLLFAACGLVPDPRISCVDLSAAECEQAVAAVQTAGADLAEAAAITVRAGCPADQPCPPAVHERLVVVEVSFPTGARAAYAVDRESWTVTDGPVEGSISP